MHLARIDFKRVQTFLFAVPRLRAMTGANTLLGEAIRIELPRLAIDCGAVGAPESVQRYFPSIAPDDPLTLSSKARRELAAGQSRVEPDLDVDDPRATAAAGVLTRDGGHFTALFRSDVAAEEFLDAARSQLASGLPGLRIEAWIRPLAAAANGNGAGLERSRGSGVDDENFRPPTPSQEHHVAMLPIFQVCQETGRDPAVALASMGPDKRWVSARAAALLIKGEAFAAGQQGHRPTRDIVGLLGAQLALAHVAMPHELSELVSGRRAKDQDGDPRDYLAVIHADGNLVGSRFEKYRATVRAKVDSDGLKEAGEFDTESLRQLAIIGEEERFFHSMRVIVRKALTTALDQVFGMLDSTDFGDFRPYQLLMQGGDDLLMICRARYALDFVKAYALALEQETAQMEDGMGLRLGVGVVLAQASVPMHRLIALAAELEASAKRLAKAGGGDVSAVDWMVFTESWADDPLSARRRDAYRRESAGDQTHELALSRKPYRVLDIGDGEPSLEGLLGAARSLSASERVAFARNQRRALTESMARGRLEGELAFHELPAMAREWLRAQPQFGGRLPWAPAGAVPGDDGGVIHRWVSTLPDFVEVMEIETLGRGMADSTVETEEAVAET